MRFRISNHAVFKTEYHVVWTPRYRRKLLVAGIKQYLENLLRRLDGLEPDIEVQGPALLNLAVPAEAHLFWSR